MAPAYSHKLKLLVRTVGLLVIIIFFNKSVAQFPVFRPVISATEINQENFNFIYQDHNCLMWIGTDAGLYTYDGIALNTILLPDTLEQKNLTCIFENSKNQYYLGFHNGLALKYDGFNQYTLVNIGDNFGKGISYFAEDLEENIWMGTFGNGIFVLNKDTSLHFTNKNGLSDNYIYSMIMDKSGDLWAGTDNGINRCRLEDGEFQVESYSVKDGLPDFIVGSLRCDMQGKIWMGMYNKGICYFDPKSKKFVIPKGCEDWEYGPVNDIEVNYDRIWIATQNEGIIEYRFQSRTLYLLKEFREYNPGKVKKLLTDSEANTWFLSNHSISLSMGNKIGLLDNINGKKFVNINALISDDAYLWLASDEGLYKYNPYEPTIKNQFTFHPLMTNQANQKLVSLYKDKYGNLWIGTFGQGVLRYDPETKALQVISERDGLGNDNVLAIDGNDRELWLGTLGGASRIKLNPVFNKVGVLPEIENFGKSEGLVNNYIYHVHISEGTVYFATDGSGVIKYSAGSFSPLTPGHKISNKAVYSVTSDPNGKIYMNVANDGIYWFDGQHVQKIIADKSHEELSFSGIKSIGHELVMVYDDGMDVLNIIEGSIVHYEENAGLFQLNPSLNTLTIDSNNNVWIGTANGIIKYHNKEQILNKPKIYLSEISLFLDKINPKTERTFSFNENYFSFRFSGLWYQYPEKVNYKFRLDGHDIDWINSSNNQAIYSNLNPGTYTFKVKAGLYNNFIGANETDYHFVIRKPFYSTLWFIILLISFLGIVFYLLVRRRISQVKRKQQAISDKIRWQFENLKSQVNPHFLFNSFSTLIALIESDQKMAVEYVEELSELFRSVLEYKDLDLISFTDELAIAGNYIKVQKKRFGNNLIVNIDDNDMDPGLKIPPLTLQLLIENALKHNIVSSTKPLKIEIFIKHSELSILVRNNLQPKQEPSNSTGIGINNIINRYNLLTDKPVKIEKSKNHFIVILPFIR
ncbi:MAG: histidine kinase [Bacteroidales bacterium]|nr:histidine kinase [Bacteroidales bacterium]MCF8403135.1 histidine kinase [Bacteroidales bacterium]